MRTSDNVTMSGTLAGRLHYSRSRRLLYLYRVSYPAPGVVTRMEEEEKKVNTRRRRPIMGASSLKRCLRRRKAQTLTRSPALILARKKQFSS